MLQKLSIQNYTLIDALDIEFNKGLNIITGETGAGKSILLGALALLLGQRAEGKYFFNQSKKCIIEGHFLANDSALQSVFESYDLDFFAENILRREISMDGRSRAFINDTPVNLNVLKTIGEQLIDIHTQNATAELNTPAFQYLLLDGLANQLQEVQDYKKEYHILKGLKNELQILTAQAIEAQQKQDYEQFLFDELENANLKIDEQSALEQELELLKHAEQIKRSLNLSEQYLSNGELDALSLLKSSLQELQSIAAYDSRIAELAARLQSCHIELKDIAQEIEAIDAGVQMNESRMEIIQERLDLLYQLQQKHRLSDVAGLIALQENLSERLHALVSDQAKIEALEKQIEQQTTLLFKKAETISARRHAIASSIEMQITEVLKQIGIPNARIQFDIQDLKSLNAQGINALEILFSANVGSPLATVGKVASGGELSRLMLAAKSLLAKHTSLPTIIFDEIDTGISGETAIKVSSILEALGSAMQVITITHLPQIAAKGDTHFMVEKYESQHKTLTRMRQLEPQERIMAIAEMLSGKDPKASAIANAKELLN